MGRSTSIGKPLRLADTLRGADISAVKFSPRRVPNSVAFKCYDFPDGSRMGSAVRHHSPPKIKHSPRAAEWTSFGKERPDDPSRTGVAGTAGSSDRDEANAARSLRRSKKNLKAWIRTHQLTRLLTFTNGAAGDGWATRREALDSVSSFLRDTENRSLFGDTPIVCVAERGGAARRWHVHACIRNGYRLDYSRIINAWSTHMTNSGYISTSASGTHRFHSGDEHGKAGRGFSSARVAGEYMAKYMSKSFIEERDPYEHVYRSCGGSAPVPRALRFDSLAAALDGLHLRAVNIHALEWLNGETGELHTYGVVFDTG